MRGNEIVVTPATEQKGVRDEGYVKTGETHYPGMIVQRDASVALIGGRHTYKIYATGTDGALPVGAFWVVTNDAGALRGAKVTDSYAAGEKESLYAPQPGEELNLLLKDIAGTGDDHALGEILIVDDATGKLIATTGSPATKVAQLLETVTDPTGDTLAWCQWSGH